MLAFWFNQICWHWRIWETRNSFSHVTSIASCTSASVAAGHSTTAAVAATTAIGGCCWRFFRCFNSQQFTKNRFYSLHELLGSRCWVLETKRQGGELLTTINCIQGHNVVLLDMYTLYAVWYMVIQNDCHTQYTWDSSICIFLFNRTTLPVFVTYLTGALCGAPFVILQTSTR